MPLGFYSCCPWDHLMRKTVDLVRIMYKEKSVLWITKDSSYLLAVECWENYSSSSLPMVSFYVVSVTQDQLWYGSTWSSFWNIIRRSVMAQDSVQWEIEIIASFLSALYLVLWSSICQNNLLLMFNMWHQKKKTRWKWKQTNRAKSNWYVRHSKALKTQERREQCRTNIWETMA